MPCIYAIANHARFLFVVLALSLIAVAVACASEPTATPEPTPTHTPVPFNGDWETIEGEIDPLSLTNIVGTGLWSNRGGHALIIRCSEANLDLYVIWGVSELRSQANSNSSQIEVRHKIDDGSLWELQWGLSDDNDSTLLPGREIETEDVIRRLFNAERFVVQVTPDDSGPITAVFHPAGLYWAVKPVLEACDVEIN